MLNKKIQIKYALKSKRAKWVQMAGMSAKSALKTKLENQVDYNFWFNDLMKALKFNFSKVSCIDVSHTQGKETIGVVVVFNENGPVKDSYRKFNIKTTSVGDDCKAIREVLERYVLNLEKQNKQLPEVILIDGGRGQFSAALKVLKKHLVVNYKLLAIAKGPLRKPGLENIFISETGEKLHLNKDAVAFLLLQHIRDEAHRFAITGHRKKSAKRLKYSSLEDIPGIGAKRRKALLCHFGGMQEIMQASCDELMLVPGINKELAEKIIENREQF